MKMRMLIVSCLFLSLLSCGPSQEELEEQKVREDAAKLKKKLDKMQDYINTEKKELDALKESLDTMKIPSLEQ